MEDRVENTRTCVTLMRWSEKFCLMSRHAGNQPICRQHFFLWGWVSLGRRARLLAKGMGFSRIPTYATRVMLLLWTSEPPRPMALLGPTDWAADNHSCINRDYLFYLQMARRVKITHFFHFQVLRSECDYRRKHITDRDQIIFSLFPF